VAYDIQNLNEILLKFKATPKNDASKLQVFGKGTVLIGSMSIIKNNVFELIVTFSLISINFTKGRKFT